MSGTTELFYNRFKTIQVRWKS